MSSVALWLKEEYILKFGEEKWEEHLKLVKEMWRWIKTKIKVYKYLPKDIKIGFSIYKSKE
jgi:hypothetical protein